MRRVISGPHASVHRWQFYRAGGLDQVVLNTGSDIANLASLDQKLWMALSCPLKGTRFDAKTLEMLDTDSDGRVRVPEVLAAVAWLQTRLCSLDTLLAGSESLPLAAITTETPEGRALLANAKRLLANLGKPDAGAVALADVADTAAIFAKTRFNGDGVIPPDAADDADTRQAIADMIATKGGVVDRTGKPGVDQATTDAFFEAATAFLAWHRRADATVLPLGDKTASAAAALAAVRAKVDDYFTRCRLAAFDSRAAGPLNRADADFVALADQELADDRPALAAFPLSTVAADRDLPLQTGLNPFWAVAMAAFHAAVVAPRLGAACDTLSATQWATLKAEFAPFEAWQASRAGGEVAAWGAARLEALLAGDARAQINALIGRDRALESENARIDELERLLRLHAHLAALLNNYVNMSCLYNPRVCAIFQVGTLYMDARACDLCFHVDDIAAHAAQASASKCCLVYCMLSRSGTRETRLICAAFTAGIAQTLWAGRNGIFYDRDGRDWDAVIVKILDNAISLKEAFWDPWRKIGGLIGDQVRKLLASKNDALLAGASKKLDLSSLPLASAAAPSKMEGAALASSVAALGIAVGLVGSAIGGLVGVIMGLPPWKAALGIVAVIMMVSGPSVILTWFRLRARDLAPILNACGWAVNRRLHLSLTLGRLFTSEAVLPAHAQLQLIDPYADRKNSRLVVLIMLALALLVVALWRVGVFAGG